MAQNEIVDVNPPSLNFSNLPPKKSLTLTLKDFDDLDEHWHGVKLEFELEQATTKKGSEEEVACARDETIKGKVVQDFDDGVLVADVEFNTADHESPTLPGTRRIKLTTASHSLATTATSHFKILA